ncbi:hypothetical protein [Chamaesiphon sp.]|uniref:hypothetical protein n=1 Tax=Chamaesiphon sp. TaxID=2814140 RepID=UPI003593C641
MNLLNFLEDAIEFIELLSYSSTPKNHFPLDFSCHKLDCLYNVENPAEITSLCLSSNNLESVPDCIRDFINLRELKLEGNRLTDLPDWIGRLTKIQSLNINMVD